MSRYNNSAFNKQQKMLQNLTQSFGKPSELAIQQCNYYLDELKKNLDIDQFFWVVNLKEQRIERTAGVFKHLGYPDNLKSDSNKLTLFDIYYMVHEDMQELIQAQREKALPHLFKVFQSQLLPLSNDYLYKVVVAFNPKNYQPILVKQKSTAFQLDEKGNMLSYLSFHEIVRDYKGEHPSVEIIIDKKRRLELEELVGKSPTALINQTFTKRQKQILKIVADYESIRKAHEKKILSNADIAELLISKKIVKSIKENTIHTHKTNILNRARDKYSRTFSKLRDLAIFLRNLNLI